MSMPLKNVIFAIAVLMLGVVFEYLSSELPDRTIQGVPGPAFFPGLISGFVIILSVALLIKGLIGLKHEPAITRSFSIPYKASLILGLFLVFLVIFPYAGFLVAGIPFFAALMVLCEKNSPLRIILGSVLIPVFLYFLFREGFRILLPAGVWV